MDDDNLVTKVIAGVEYVLRRELGWFELARIQEMRTRMVVPTGTARITRESIVEVQPNRAAYNLARLKARIKAWSRSEPLGEASIKGLPPAHASVLLATIDELENAERGLGLSESEKN